MDARFAGSQRLGDRRRRRLAVETEDSQTESSDAKGLASPEGMVRNLHREPVSEQATSSVPDLPLGTLIPSQWWKYLAGGIGGALLAGGLLAAAWYESIWSTLTGTGIPRLFRLPDAPVAAWYSSLLLNVSAQLAILIWWGRSRSLKDFDGRYHVWTRTAGAWLLFSFCAATGAHDSLSTAILHFWPLKSPQAHVLLWLFPAAGLGLNRLLALDREMKDCRASRTLLYTAAVSYAIAGVLRLELAYPFSEKVHHLLAAGMALLGHLALFVSMWVHARHVLYFTADPSHAPRRRLRIPRPHFRLPRMNFGWKRKVSALPATSEPGATERPARRRKPRKTPAKEVEAVTETPAPEASEVPQPAVSRRSFRIDSRHPAPVPEPEPTPEPQIEAELENEQPAEEFRSSLQPEPSAAHFEPEEPAGDRQEPEFSQREETHSQDDAGDDEGTFGDGPKPDLRGMSKKQRRRILAELREKERSNRRR